MSTVETVGGPVDVADLGRVLMHEHVFVLTTEVMQEYGDASRPAGWWDEDERVADAVRKLSDLKAAGIDTIVDPTVLGLGRHLPRVQRVAEQVDLRIIVATGFYTYDALPHFFDNVGPGTLLGGDDPLVTMMRTDLTDGIAGTGVKAAFLKCAVDAPGLTAGVERVLRAVGQVSAETGAPVTVHTASAQERGRDALRVLGEMGADLTKVVVGHAGDSNDLGYLQALADTGAILGMDRFGLDVFNPTDDRVATIAALARAGYADRMVLAHDASCYIDWFAGDQAQQALAGAAPHWNFQHISADVLPALLTAGVSQADIDQMLVDTPRRYFTGATS